MDNNEYKKVQNGPKNSIPEHFIPNGMNPDNGALWAELNNPLCSKGNSVIAEDYSAFQKGAPVVGKKA